MREIITKYGLLVVLVLLVMFFSNRTEVFLTLPNFINILRQVSIMGIVSVGMAFVLISGGIDLSVGSIIGVSSVLAATLMVNGVNIPTAFLATLIAGVLIGLFNGLMINNVKIPPLITTLGSMTIFRGAAYIITGGLPVYGFSAVSFSFLGQGYINIIPVPVLVMAAVFLSGFIVLYTTRFGRYVHAIGGNETASELSGIPVKKIKYFVYAISGFLASLAGLVLLSRINSGQPNAGQGYELDIVTAVVLGGVSIYGGEGRLSGVLSGILIMGILTNGMILMNVNEYYQLVVKGAVLLAAVGTDVYISNMEIKDESVVKGQN
ncbi:ABC transporter permease [Candidatus Contubernalis alkalaceticus]|nr:ABC transporter permease [Candidatus Contubernalis alkalaceticus]